MDFHPAARDGHDANRGDPLDSDEDDLAASQMAPAAAARPSLPSIDSAPSAKHAARRTELIPRAQQFSDLDAKLGLARQVSLDTAAETAKNRRSIATGMLRMQPQGAVDPEHLSFLFGGSAKPKLATTKVNILKEKEKAMAWIKDEQKKYDLEVLKQDLTS